MSERTSALRVWSTDEVEAITFTVAMVVSLLTLVVAWVCPWWYALLVPIGYVGLALQAIHRMRQAAKPIDA